MFVDLECQLYNVFGLKCFVVKVWSIFVLVYYVEQKCVGRKFVVMFDEDDFIQMGGDFVFDKNGKFVLIYCSKVFIDRFLVENFLKCVRDFSVFKNKENS